MRVSLDLLRKISLSFFKSDKDTEAFLARGWLLPMTAVIAFATVEIYGKLKENIDVKKFGKQWIITRAAMEREYGPQPKGQAQ